MRNGLATDLAQLVADPARVLTAPAVVEKLSRDFYWYSPILRRQLEGKVGDIVVQPVNQTELIAVMRTGLRMRFR